MTAGLPENNRERNAFHEAGHVVAAWRVIPNSIGSVEIGHYTSRSRICCHGFNPEEQSRVAVAGALAEARGIANRKLEGNFNPVGARIVMHIEMRESDGAQWLDIPVAGGTEKAAFSDDDFLLLHTNDHGSNDRVTERLQQTASIIEEHIADGRILKLYKLLLNRGWLAGDEVRRLIG
jgi:hypothetical protein